MSWRELSFTSDEYLTVLKESAKAKTVVAKIEQEVKIVEDELKDEEAELAVLLRGRPAERRVKTQDLRDKLYQARRALAEAKEQMFMTGAEEAYYKDRLRIYSSLPYDVKVMPEEIET